MTALVAAVTAFDLRLLGCALRQAPASILARRLLPWVWAGFAVQVVTGVLLFSSEAVKIYDNPAFRLKLILIGIAGIQALVFQFTAYRRLAEWDERGHLPVAARVSGGLSMLLWVAIVAAGRFIGFL